MINLITNCLKSATIRSITFSLTVIFSGHVLAAQPINLFQTQTPLVVQEQNIQPVGDAAKSVLERTEGRQFPQTENQPAKISVPELPSNASATEELPPPLVELPVQPQDDAPVTDPTRDNDDMDILTRGPLHEAFAAVHQSNPEPSLTIQKTPPETIEELPPEFKPEGTNVVWIPGYWAWDDSKDDFIWISGVWRDVPPGRKWVPGYWDEITGTATGYRWVTGFWTEETSDEVDYLPAPPASIDQGPSVAAPSDNHFYVPGNWSYQNNRYLWQTGHWQPVVKNWIWIPARYVWTPLGCVYQSGYWDYDIANRGTCFAPVYFQRPVYQTASYYYRPSCAVNLNIDFLTHLFVRPNCGHYFYGDWYSNSFVSYGYRPWVNYTSHFRRYDPLLAYYGCQTSTINPRFSVVQYLTNQHSFYLNNSFYRPRTTFLAQSAFLQSSVGLRNRDYITRSCYVQPFADVVRARSRYLAQTTRDLQRQQNRFQRLQQQEIALQKKRIEQTLRLQRERKRIEVKNLNRQIAKTSPVNPKLKLKQVNATNRNIARSNATIEKIRRDQERAQRDARREIQKSVERSRSEAAKIARNNEAERRKLERERSRQQNSRDKVQQYLKNRPDSSVTAKKLQRQREIAIQKAEKDRQRLARQREDAQQKIRSKNTVETRRLVQKQQKAQADALNKQREQQRLDHQRAKAAASARATLQERAQREATRRNPPSKTKQVDAAKRARDQQRIAQAQARAAKENADKQRRLADSQRRAQEAARKRQAGQQAAEAAKRQRDQKRIADQRSKAARERMDQQRRAQDSARRAAEQQRRRQADAQRAAQQQRAREARKQQLRSQQEAARRASQQRSAERARQRAAQKLKRKK